MDEGSLEAITAFETVRRAAAFCRLVREELVASEALLKSDRSPVTVADFGSQAIICKRLKDVFPHDPIIAEEDSRELTKPGREEVLGKVTRYVNRFVPEASREEICEWIDLSTHEPKDRFWTLDPIDGTKGFLRGDQYAIALALIENGRVVLGVMACPNLHVEMNEPSGEKGCVFVGIRGTGAVQIDLPTGAKRRVFVSKTADPSKAILTESVETEHGDFLCHERLARHLDLSAPPVKIDSEAKYGVVARGEATLYVRVPSPAELDYKEKIWDHAAGAIIAEEAGGTVTDVLGRSLDFSSGEVMSRNHGILATNGVLHDAVLEGLRKAGCRGQ
jgi:3'(2'), 5'-bisphosphate nucleotidase